MGTDQQVNNMTIEDMEAQGIDCSEMILDSEPSRAEVLEGLIENCSSQITNYISDIDDMYEIIKYLEQMKLDYTTELKALNTK